MAALEHAGFHHHIVSGYECGVLSYQSGPDLSRNAVTGILAIEYGKRAEVSTKTVIS